MKKLFLATFLFAGLTAVVPSASAGHNERVFAGYDRCGHPVYREVCREEYRPRRDYYEERPTYYREAPPVRYRSYEEERPRCRETQRHFSPLSFIFGF